VHLGRSGRFNRRRENAAIPCGVRLSDGGHERSRTSDPYSVNLVRAFSRGAYNRPRVPILKRFSVFGYSTPVHHRLLVTTPKGIIKCVTRRSLISGRIWNLVGQKSRSDRSSIHRTNRERSRMSTLYITLSALRVSDRTVRRRRHGGGATLRLGRISMPGSRFRADPTPLRTISGTNTGLDAPVGIGVNSAGTIFVAHDNNNTTTSYAPGANGNVAPTTTIGGSSTMMAGATGLSLH
jgi:hypothetical protein